MTACWIALGGNVGNVAETFERSLSALNQMPGIEVVKHSRNYSTSPVGKNAGDRYINAAAQLEVQGTPLELLDSLQAVESQFGRVRQLRWGPRTLDLDLLFYAQQIIATARLTVPHPYLWFRRFALDPLTEIASGLVHPQHRMTIEELRGRLMLRPLPCLLVGGDVQERLAVQQQLAAEFPQTSWQPTALAPAWLAFDLTAPSTASGASTVVPPARVIELSRFPTSAAESIRDVLRAALDEAHPA